MGTCLRTLSIFAATAACLLGANLSDRVLVVHNTAVAASISVANYYVAKRQIPAVNRCAITSASDSFISLNEYKTLIQTPIQKCLNAVGSTKILYIVMTYGVPYGILDKRRFALDSYVADVWDQYTTQVFATIPNAVHPYYADFQAEGGYYLPFQSLASYRTTNTTKLIYSVWRLDGPSPALANGLVDRAIATELAGGPFGQGCFDWRMSLATNPDLGYTSGDWDISRASSILRDAGIRTLEDSLDSQMTACPNAAFYAGWYGLTYNDVFGWNPGAIGWHLDSSSAYNPRDAGFWAPGAIASGITATSGSLDEPYLEGMVRPSGMFRNLLEGANIGDAFLRNTRWLKWEIFYFGDPLYTPFAGGKAPFNSGGTTDSFFISNPRSIVGGYDTATGTITVAKPAPVGGRLFTLSATYAGAVATYPAFVTVPQGQTKVSFSIGGTLRTYGVNDLLSATSGPLQLRNSLFVNQLLSALTLPMSTIKGGQSMPAIISLNTKIGSMPVAVSLRADNPAVLMPTSVTIPANSTAGLFNIATSRVTAPTDVTITATYAGTKLTAVLTLVP